MISIRTVGKLAMMLVLCTVAVLANPDSRLVGSWVQEGQGTVWTFRPDGSGFMEQANPRTTARFTWDCAGQRLNVSTPAGNSVPYTVMSCDSGSLIIRNDQASSVYKLRKK